VSQVVQDRISDGVEDRHPVLVRRAECVVDYQFGAHVAYSSKIFNTAGEWLLAILGFQEFVKVQSTVQSSSGLKKIGRHSARQDLPGITLNRIGVDDLDAGPDGLIELLSIVLNDVLRRLRKLARINDSGVI
jgi:hypothetical protein